MYLEDYKKERPVLAQSLKTTSLTANRPNRSQWANGDKLRTFEADTVMESVADLVTVAYKPKYFKALYKIGPQQFLEFAERARKGKLPQHLFRHLIDEATSS